MQYIYIILALFCTSFILTAAPVHANELTNMIYVADSIPSRVLEGDLANVRGDVTDLESYVTTENLAATTSIATMQRFFDTSVATKTTPAEFLIATNEVYKTLQDQHYAVSEPVTPDYIYQLRYLARKLQFQSIAPDWQVIEKETADDLLVLTSTIHRTVQDDALWQNTLRPLNDRLRSAVENQNQAQVYDVAQAYLSVIPTIHTTANIAVADPAPPESTSPWQWYTFVAAGLALLLGGYWHYRRRQS